MTREFVLWTDERFIGFTKTFDEAKALVRQQEPGEKVFVVDFDATPETQCLVLVDGGMLTGRMGWSNCLRGLQLAGAALACDLTAKRDRMLQTQAAISQKYPLGMPSLDSPPNPDWECWRQVQRDFDEAKALHTAFCGRYAALAH